MNLYKFNKERIKIHEAKKFAITLAIVLSLWGSVFLLREKSYSVYFFIFSATFLLIGLLAPFLMRPLYALWMLLTGWVGWLITRLVLILIFYGVITPMSFLLKLLGKDLLLLKLDRNTSTYWRPKEKQELSKSQYENQF
jgi:hypothetical protein